MEPVLMMKTSSGLLAIAALGGLTLAGIRTLRFTWSQANRRRSYVVSALRSAFA